MNLICVQVVHMFLCLVPKNTVTDLKLTYRLVLQFNPIQILPNHRPGIGTGLDSLNTSIITNSTHIL